MLLNFLKRYAPVLMFIAVLGACIALAVLSFRDPETEDEVKDARKNIKTVEEKLTAGVVTPEYVYSEDQLKKIKLVETLKQDVDKNKRTTDEQIGVFVSYPQPTRVKSEAPIVAPDATPIIGVLPYLKDKAANDFEVEAGRGKIYIKCELPKPEEFKSAVHGDALMEPVRIEIFRGLDKNKIDLVKPWATIELGVEDPAAAKVAAGPAVPTPPVAPAEVKSSGSIARGGPKDPKDAKDPKAKPFVLPATTRVYRDTTDIQQMTEYFYQARLVARFTKKEGEILTEQQANGKAIQYVYKLPNDPNLLPVKPSNPASTAKLFATPLTGVKFTKTPTNFQLRVSGITGKVPPLGFIRNPASHDNKDASVSFEINVWVSDSAEWKKLTLQDIHEGDVLSGKILYSKGGEKKEYDFTKDLGYKLYEVNMEELDSKVNGQKVTKEAVLLENQKTKKMEHFVQESKLITESPKLSDYDKIIDAQDKEMEKIKKAAATPGPAAPTPAAPAPAPVAPTK